MIRTVLGDRPATYRAYGGMPGLAYLPARFLPRVRERLGDEMTDRLMVTNPRAVLSLRTPESPR